MSPYVLFWKSISVCVLFLFIATMGSSKDFEYLQEIPIGYEFVYEHWDQKNKKVTGLSIYRYSKKEIDGGVWIEEFNENTKPNRKAFTEKSTLFSPETGKVTRYIEKDFRKKYQIQNTYSQNKIKSHLTDGEQEKTWSLDIKKRLVPLEVVTLHLRKKWKKLQKKKSIVFDLYIPALAIELEKNGFSPSYSLIEMEAEVGKNIEIDTPLGKKTGQEVHISPTNWFIKTVLPKDKTNFLFIFETTEPHYLVRLEQGQYQHTLVELNSVSSP